MGSSTKFLEVDMGKHKKKKPILRIVLFTTIAGLLVLATGAGRKETAPVEEVVKPRVITARFTDPVELEPQDSQKCIACHTKTNPITKLASPTVAGGEAGG